MKYKDCEDEKDSKQSPNKKGGWVGKIMSVDCRSVKSRLRVNRLVMYRNMQ